MPSSGGWNTLFRVGGGGVCHPFVFGFPAHCDTGFSFLPFSAKLRFACFLVKTFSCIAVPAVSPRWLSAAAFAGVGPLPRKKNGTWNGMEMEFYFSSNGT